MVSPKAHQKHLRLSEVKSHPLVVSVDNVCLALFSSVQIKASIKDFLLKGHISELKRKR